MENPRPEKVAVVAEVRAKLDAAEAAVLTEYRGLDVSATADLRRALTEAGGEYKIYKNTLVRIAARDLGLEIDDLLTGPTAIAFVEGDPVNVAKALRDFARTNPALVIKGGLLGGSLLDQRAITALADVEPREIILAKLAGALAAPMQQFAGLLEALPRNFAYGLKALIDAGGAPGAPASTPAATESDTATATESDTATTDTPDVTASVGDAGEATESAPDAEDDTPAEPTAADATTETEPAPKADPTEKES